MVTNTGGVEVYVKKCMDSCIDNRVVTIGHSTVTQYCCKEDLCNGSCDKRMGKQTNVLILLYYIFFVILKNKFFH